MLLKRRYRFRQRYRHGLKYYQNNKPSVHIKKLNYSSNYNPKTNYSQGKKEENPINQNLFKKEIQSYPKIEEKRETKEVIKPLKKSKLALILDEVSEEKKQKKKSSLAKLLEELDNSKKEKEKEKYFASEFASSDKEEEDIFSYKRK